MALRAKDAMRLVMRLHTAAGESHTTQVLASALGRVAVARAEGRGLGKAVDEVLVDVLERLDVMEPNEGEEV